MSGTRTPGGGTAPSGQWVNDWQALQAQRMSAAPQATNALPSYTAPVAKNNAATVAGFPAATPATPTSGLLSETATGSMAPYLAAAAQDPRFADPRLSNGALRDPETMDRLNQRNDQRIGKLAEHNFGKDLSHATNAARNDLQSWLGQNGQFAWWSPAYRAQQQQAVSDIMSRFNLTPAMIQSGALGGHGGAALAQLYQRAQAPVSNPATTLPAWAGYQSGTGIWAK